MRAILVFLVLESLATIHSAIIRNPNTDKCLDGSSGKVLGQKKCSPGLPSQTWNVTSKGMIVNLEGSSKCVGVSQDPFRSLVLMNCKPTKEEERAMMARINSFGKRRNDAHKLTKGGTGIQECITLGAGVIAFMETCGNAKGNDSQDVYYE
jgi:hypothetical protein